MSEISDQIRADGKIQLPNISEIKTFHIFRGTTQGYSVELFVMVSNYDEDRVSS